MSLSHLIVLDFRYISGLPKLRKPCFVAGGFLEADAG
jgi:hypothetical protein